MYNVEQKTQVGITNFESSRKGFFLSAAERDSKGFSHISKTVEMVFSAARCAAGVHPFIMVIAQ